MLTIEQLSLRRGSLEIFTNYSRQISTNRCCLTGINGSGKSSLLAAIAGLLSYQGQISWQGKRLQLPRHQVALASDSIIFPEFLLAQDLISLQQTMWRTASALPLVECFVFTSQLHKTIAELSTGNLKKLQLILAFMRQPELLLLDEPNIALDDGACKTLFALIANYPGTIILASNEAQRFADLQFALNS